VRFGILDVETIREYRIGFAPRRSGGEREGESPVSPAYHHTAPAIGVGGGFIFNPDCVFIPNNAINRESHE